MLLIDLVQKLFHFRVIFVIFSFFCFIGMGDDQPFPVDDKAVAHPVHVDVLCNDLDLVQNNIKRNHAVVIIEQLADRNHNCARLCVKVRGNDRRSSLCRLCGHVPFPFPRKVIIIRHPAYAVDIIPVKQTIYPCKIGINVLHIALGFLRQKGFDLFGGCPVLHHVFNCDGSDLHNIQAFRQVSFQILPFLRQTARPHFIHIGDCV